MRHYFLRHGIAEETSPDGSDAARRLMAEGIEEMRHVADALARMELRVDIILASPRIRALKTAEIVAEALGLRRQLQEEPRLSGGCSLGELQAIVRDHAQARRLMLVGHEPDMGYLSGLLTGGAQVDVKKGGLIRIRTEAIEPGAGLLEWVLPPSVLLRSRDR